MATTTRASQHEGAGESGALPPPLLFINGAWRESADGATRIVENPATETEVASVPLATPRDLDEALEAADAGFRRWRSTSAWERADALRAFALAIREQADRFALVMTLEQGKPLAQARGEVLASADQFDWYADEARRIYGRTVEARDPATRILVRREPIGPVAAFAAWNFPSLLSARKIAPALAAGCSIVVMAPIEAPLSTLLFAEVAERTGLPAGVLNVVTGEPADVSRHLITSEVIRKVSLTGSVPVGVELARLAAEGMKTTSMELGGHAPVLVFPDTDVRGTAVAAARGKFRNGGQVCIAASRFLVHESVSAEFTEAFVAETRELRVGDGRDPGVDLGPLTTSRRRAEVRALVEDAVGAGATLEHGGGVPEEFDAGYFFTPTVLSGVRPEMRVMREEPFGPVAPLTTFASFDEAIALANSTPYGLGGFVFTRDLATAHRASEALEVGMVGVNHLTIATAEAPFGGVKLSGHGREGGSEGVDGYTVTKYTSMRLDGPS
ncbi:NAD-dependent succinate-semialdehyde dehydrogenase [Streptomyces sp. AJS327]|uniref:NAD-dependent succinate-semialdehyde dehydrogenase n=1 Tax=Streptomyces sp. AJS327 TaxID=2545265 RepID=UPI0015DF3822|nr:NAD-dependent succinate-semialdehyde dehydrogenase [Streptomyces sp. AJS327]MBA0051277.1 NAD-dependent succinate-semialdehyde dehydrogenase [Streptomyces sp. AJS327]